MADFTKEGSPEKKKEENKEEEKPATVAAVAADGDDGDEGDEDPVSTLLNFHECVCIQHVFNQHHRFCNPFTLFVVIIGWKQEAESTATFTPVVHLEAVEVQSGEEDEDVLWKQ